MNNDINELIKNLRWYGSYACDVDRELMYKAAKTIEDLLSKIRKDK